jgi:hypothetical protein
MRLSTLGNYKFEVPSSFTFVGSCVTSNSTKKEEVREIEPISFSNLSLIKRKNSISGSRVTIEIWVLLQSLWLHR